MAAIWTLLVACNAKADASGYRQAILVQNSGWMEPFFTDPQSPLIPLVSAFGEQLAVGGSVAVASFNQEGQIPGRSSPHVLYRGAFRPGTVPNALVGLDLPRRPDKHYADADFQGALLGAIGNLLDGRPGAIWMVTNNKNAPGNDPRVQENTRAYFRQLSNSDAISRLAAFPLRMPVKGRNYSENGLIIYGIGYGEEGGRILDALVGRINASGLFSDPAVVLKPLDKVPLRFLPERIHPPHLKAQWRNRALIVEGLRGAEPQEVLIEGRLRSDFYPHVIAHANLRVNWQAHTGLTEQGALVQAAVSPAVLDNLEPLGNGDAVTVRLRVPAMSRPPGSAGLRQERVHMVGLLNLSLDDVSLHFSANFIEKMQALYGLDQLPALFFDNRRITSGSAGIPVRLSLEYSLLPIFVLIGSLAVLVLGGGGAFVLLKVPRTDTVRVGSAVRKVTLSPFQKRELSDPATGARVEVTMGLLGKAAVRNLNEEKQ